MKRHLLVVISCLLAGCTTREAVEPQTQSRETTKPGELLLSAESQKIAGLEIRRIEPESVAETISAPGQLIANEDTTSIVGALADGRIASVRVRLGDFVKEGQILARIHSHDVHETRAAYKTAQLELARAEATQRQAERIRNRARRLLDLKAGSQQELEGAEAVLREAQTSVGTARTAVERERTHLVEFLEVSPDDEDHEKPHAEDFIPVKSPAPGVVTERKVTPGSVVQSGQEVFHITNPATLWMIVNVNEADLSHLRPGQTVRVLVRAYPETPFTGRILRLGEEMDATTRTLQVRVLVPNPRNLLKPQMYATAEIERSASRPSLFVPESAAQDLNGARVVFLRTGPERFEARAVEVSRTVNGRMEVVRGLASGDNVVVKGSFVLKSQLLRNSLGED